MRQQETSVDVEEELRVAVKARQELGIDHEDEVIESFLARVQGTIDARVEARVDEELRRPPHTAPLRQPLQWAHQSCHRLYRCLPRFVDSDSQRSGRVSFCRHCRQHRGGRRYANTPGRERAR